MAALSSPTMRILVVDDTEDARELYAEYLSFRGYDVSQASNGQEAVLASFAQLPAVIIMDLDMPVMDGWTATKILKQDPRTRTIPIIVVTGAAMPAQLLAAREAGCDVILRKPCSPHAVFVVIQHVLSGETVPPHLCAA